MGFDPQIAGRSSLNVRLPLALSYNPSIKMPNSITEELTRNRDVFERLVRLADGSKGKGHYDRAVAYAQVAAQFAWHNHSGLLASSPLECILAKVGRQRMRQRVIDKTGEPNAWSPRALLHVMSAAYTIGGHTRFVKRWVELDSGRAHSLVLTQQGSTPAPEWLLEAVLASGGTVYFLDRKWGGLLSRADRLRKLAQKADFVVLHIHPSDAIPVVAFADKRGLPPIIFLNHADHVFWLGTSTGDVFANIRQSAVDLSCDRRGISRGRCAILPVPLETPHRTIGRTKAKKALGLPADSIVLLSVASEYKYTSLGEMTFLSTLMPVLESSSKACLLVIGPTQQGEWEDAARRLPGRVCVLGAIEDPSPYYEAADIYIDSFPFGSLTSLLEAGSYGIPVISFSPFSAEADIFRPDDPAIDNGSLRIADIARYRASIERLIQDEILRKTLGEKTQENILQVHTGAGWKDCAEELYKRAVILRAEPPTDEMCTSQQQTELDSLLVRIHAKCGFSLRAEDVMRSQIGFLPFGRRLALWLRNPNSARVPLRRVLVSEGIRAVLRGLTRSAEHTSKI